VGVKIVIYGLAKSGTTALFYKIRNSLPADTICHFEPSHYTLRDRALDRLRAVRRGRIARDVVAKVLPWDSKPVRVADFDRFERKIILVRDPRDRLVSHLLYKSYNARFVRDSAAAVQFLTLLRRKEADPRSVPMVRLFEAFDALERDSDWIDQYHRRGVQEPLRFHRERPEIPVFRYEQMVDGRFDDLETIVGLPLGGAPTVPPDLQRVVRTKSYGAWREWFTPEDVDALRPLLQPYLDSYYPDASWELGPAPRLDPKYGSAYVESIINERRGLWGLEPLPAAR
jgi:hypothetical protein